MTVIQKTNPFGPQVPPDGAPALPLWIGGRAYLMMAQRFYTVTGADGAALRRVPLCGAEAAAIAVNSTVKALPVWREVSGEARDHCFRQVHALLARYRGHLAGLIAEETHVSHELADAELEQALAVVAGMVSGPRTGSGVVVVLGDALTPLAGALVCTAEALAAGWGVILKPSPKAPSALFALAELFTRAGFPDGIVNLVQGDTAIIEALFAHEAVAAAAFCGGEPLAGQIGALAVGTGTLYAQGATTGDTLLARWRQCLGQVQ